MQDEAWEVDLGFYRSTSILSLLIWGGGGGVLNKNLRPAVCYRLYTIGCISEFIDEGLKCVTS